MRTKHLFYSLALSAAFAACSQEEIVSQQGAANIDLGNRPVVGKVTLDLGGLESRGTIAEDGEFNSIEFIKGEDGFGARIIDAYTPSASYATYGDHPYRNYTPTSYASSNYKYINAGGQAWETDALMVEGNYLFYYPYNEANLARTANAVYLPMKQTVSAEIPNQPIKDLYEGENPAIVGYAFLKAEGQEATVTPELNHIFAYPQFTFVNEFTVKEKVGFRLEDVPKAVTITKAIVKYKGGDNFYKKGTIKHWDGINNPSFINAFRNFELAQVKNGNTEVYPAVSKGNWAMSKSSLLKTAKTADFVEWITEGSNVAGDIEVIFDGGLTLEPEESFSFNLVMPAGQYEDAELEFTVYLDNDKMFTTDFTVDDNNYTYLNYAPGLRYPAEEYNNLNTNPTTKPSKGKLGTITLKGDLKDAVEPAAIIDDIDEFEAYLNSIGDNSANLVEVATIQEVDEENEFTLARNDKGVAYMQINSAVMELIKKYLSKGSVSFCSTMEVAEAAETRAAEVIALDQMIFDHVDILSGDVSVANVTANTVHVHGGTLTVPATYEGEKLGQITVDGGEVVLNKAKFVDYEAKTQNFVKVTNVVDEAGEEVSAGKLTVNANQGLRGQRTNYYFVMDAGELVIAAQKTVEFGANNYTQITGGTITNNGTINLIKDFTVAENVKLENNGAITGANLNNEGTIETSKSLTIAENIGTIKPTVGTIAVTVESGSGKVNNVNAAVVDANDEQTVYAEINGMTNLLGLRAYDKEAALDKIIITGDWTIDNADLVVTLATAKSTIETIEFKGGDLILKSGVQTLDFNGADIIINADTDWTGRSFELSTVMGIKSITVNDDTDELPFDFNVAKIKTAYYVNAEVLPEIVDNNMTIDTVEELVAFAASVEKNNYQGKTVKLGADIDLMGVNWTPIDGFKGTFDGQNYTISNFSVVKSQNAGFFGNIVATLKNVKIKDAVVSGNKSVGALVGYIYGNVTSCSVESSDVTATVLDEDLDGDNVGALVGFVGEGKYEIGACIAKNCNVVGNPVKDCGVLVGSVFKMTVIDNPTAGKNDISVGNTLNGVANNTVLYGKVH